jgi:glucosylceramidase
MKIFYCSLFFFSLISNAQNTVAIYTTSENSPTQFAYSESSPFVKSEQPLETQICVFVNSKKKFQTFLGIGGAITDASAEVFAKLSDAKQQELLEAYYSPKNGIGYTLARTNIHSCDFSSDSYTYITEGDKDLKTFSIAHDLKYRIPLLKKAITIAGKLTLFASPWSPPAFMKTTNSMLQGGKLKPEFQQSWANYYAKFVKAYEQEGIPIWGLSIQNEPMAKQSWESCIYTAEEERDFLKNYLGPTMQNQGLSDKKIIVWDHNRDLMFQRATTIFEDPIASKYAWGMGFHWYETWTGGEPMYENVKKVAETYPSKNLIFTEGCAESFNPEKYQFWANGEKYGKSMINDFNNGCVAWTDWNILLDEKGGPNHVGNFCFAPVHADTTLDKLIYTPSYYYIGHFSKFIRPEAKRINSVSSRSQLLTTSFKNKSGSVVTIVMNSSNSEVSYGLYVDNKTTTITIPSHGIQTLVY